MARFRLILEYEGTDFHGWQYQNDLRTVEGCLLEALQTLATGPVETHGSSRTDAGVHALGYCALAEMETTLSAAELRRAVQARTPPDLGVRSCECAPLGSHPRFDAVEKRYLYRVMNTPTPPVFGRGHHWWVRYPLDVAAMQEAGSALVGEHDFAAFRNRSKDEPTNTVRTVSTIDWRRTGDELFLQVIGTAFLYRMVRNLAGTLVEVGRGALALEAIPEILASGDRRQAGPSAPPQGLYLMEVAYPDTPRCALDEEPPRW